MLSRFDPLYSDRDGLSNSNRQSIIPSVSNDCIEPKINTIIESPVTLLHTSSSNKTTELSNSSEENEFISETLPIPELEQNSGANSSADDSSNINNNNTTIASKDYFNIHQPLISIGNSPSIQTINSDRSTTVGIKFATDETFLHSAVSISILIVCIYYKFIKDFFSYLG